MLVISAANRRSWLVCGALLLMFACVLMAQHRGGRGAGGKSGSTGVGDTETEQEREFARAAAVQATSDQVTQFQKLSKSTEAARKSAHDLLQLHENADQPDLFHATHSVTTAVDEWRSENQQFLKSLSGAQKSGLKDLFKKLEKADSDVAKENKALAQELEASKVGGKQVLEAAKKLDQALRDLQAKQLALGTEMGIQSAASSQ